MSKITPFPIRNHQCPPSRSLGTGYIWHTFIHARELRIHTQLKITFLWSMMSRMTQSSKYLFRDPQCPPSMTLRTGCSWHTSIHSREMTIVIQSIITYNYDPWCQSSILQVSITIDTSGKQVRTLILIFIYLSYL